MKKTKQQLIKDIKNCRNAIRLQEFKNHRLIWKMLPSFTKKELQEILNDDELELYHLMEDTRQITLNTSHSIKQNKEKAKKVFDI